MSQTAVTAEISIPFLTEQPAVFRFLASSAQEHILRRLPSRQKASPPATAYNSTRLVHGFLRPRGSEVLFIDPNISGKLIPELDLLVGTRSTDGAETVKDVQIIAAKGMAQGIRSEAE